MGKHIRPYLSLFEETAATFGDPSKPISIVETGTYIGESTVAFIRGLNRRPGGGTLVSVDHKNYEPMVRENMRKNGIDDSRWTFVLGDTKKQETIDRLKGEYDLGLVDGDHSYEGAKSDHENIIVPNLKPGGVCFYHDVTKVQFGVPKFWSEVDPADWEDKREDIREPGCLGILRKKS